MGVGIGEPENSFKPLVTNTYRQPRTSQLKMIARITDHNKPGRNDPGGAFGERLGTAENEQCGPKALYLLTIQPSNR